MQGCSCDFCLLILEGNVVHVLITLLLPFLIHLYEVDSLFWTRYLEKSLFFSTIRCCWKQHTWQGKEHFSRSSKQVQGSTNRVDVEQKDSPKAVHNLGSSSHRSVCLSNKSSDTNCSIVSEHFCLLILEGNVVLITPLLPFLIHLCEADSFLDQIPWKVSFLLRWPQYRIQGCSCDHFNCTFFFIGNQVKFWKQKFLFRNI
jgi:hypothetical protein